MGQPLSLLTKENRRRLVEEGLTYEQWFDELAEAAPEYKKLAVRPFGGYNYSYGEEWMRTASFSQWAAVTVGGLAVDWREGLGILAVSLAAQESKWKKFPGHMGASWVHNIQFGYLAYHVIFRRNYRLLVLLPALYEFCADLVAWSKIWGPFDDYAHLEGAVIGIVTGFVLDQVVKKKRPLL